MMAQDSFAGQALVSSVKAPGPGLDGLRRPWEADSMGSWGMTPGLPGSSVYLVPLWVSVAASGRPLYFLWNLDSRCPRREGE